MEHYSVRGVCRSMNSGFKEGMYFNEKQSLIFRAGLIQIILLALFILLLLSCKKKEGMPQQTPVPPISVEQDSGRKPGFRVDSSYIPVSRHLPSDVQQKLKELEALKFEKITLGDQVLDYLKKGENDFGEEFKFIDLRFDNKSFVINDKYAHEIQDLATIMKAFPNMRIEFSVYTDGDGQEKANEKLTEERGKAVKSKLAMAGIEESRISIKAFGEKYPVADNKTYEGKSINNRIEMMIQSK